jgi:hypothetical protein
VKLRALVGGRRRAAEVCRLARHESFDEVGNPSMRSALAYPEAMMPSANLASIVLSRDNAVARSPPAG